MSVPAELDLLTDHLGASAPRPSGRERRLQALERPESHRRPRRPRMLYGVVAVAGAVTATVRPAVTGSYRFRYAGDSASSPATSPARPVVVLDAARTPSTPRRQR